MLVRLGVLSLTSLCFGGAAAGISTLGNKRKDSKSTYMVPKVMIW